MEDLSKKIINPPNTTSNNNNEEVEFETLFREKCENFIKFILNHADFVGEWQKKAQELGNDLVKRLTTELILGFGMFMTLLQVKYQWDCKRILSVENSEENIKKLLEDCQNLFENVSRGIKLNEGIMFKKTLSPEELKTVQHKLYRYLCFFAQIHDEMIKQKK